MSRTLSVYVARLYLTFFAGSLLTVLAVWLVADFTDRVNLFAQYPLSDVLRLYGNKVLVAIGLLAPAAMLLAASAAVATLRKRGELTPVLSLSFGIKAVYLPIAGCALLLALGLIAFDEFIASRAGLQVDQLSVATFKSGWNDWHLYYRPKQWFRRGDRIFQLRAGDAESGFENVTIFTLSSDFKLSSRLDAARMRWLEGTRWQLSEVVERRLAGAEGLELLRDAERSTDLGLEKNLVRIAPGKPEHLRFPVLLAQEKIRREVGLPVQELQLALHNRFSYPLTGLFAALIAVGLSLRPGRQARLTLALVEGLGVAVVLWALLVFGRALVLGDHVSAPVAAWGPMAALAALSAALWKRTG